MDKLWRFNGFTFQIALYLFLCLLDFSSSLNTEGLALLRFKERVVKDPYGALLNWNFRHGKEKNPCSWSGVKCLGGTVVSLELKDLSLGGTLAPEICNLMHIKFIMLRNNSFSGVIPKGIGELKELKVLDLGYNDFSGALPSNIGNSATLLIDNNKFLGGKSSELQVDENQPSNSAQGASSNEIFNTWSAAKVGDIAYRRLLQVVNAPRSPRSKSRTNKKGQPRQPIRSSSSPAPSSSASPSPSPSPSPSISTLRRVTTIFMPPTPSPAPAQDPPSPAPADPPPPLPPPPPRPPSPPPPSLAPLTPLPSASPSPSEGRSNRSKGTWPVVSVVAGASVLLISVIGVLLCRSNKVVTVKPWVTGLSGQLQKAFVTGVPKLKRSELEAACEDFSNIIGSSSDGTMYKGTLSSGVEIAVTSSAVLSAKDWSKHLEGQFRKKIDILSKVNHKNFVNLIGFCEEEDPFTRMMVFEYAPNGTLFEHLHVKEAEHLDWGVRLRIAMGMAYCLEYLHELSPPVIHKNLLSNSVYLTEDYAAKISDLGFWTEATAAKMGSTEGADSLTTPSLDPESNIYSFGLILLEIITGRLQYSVEDGRLVDWATDYLRKERPLGDMVDSTLKYFHEGELDKLCEVIRSCIHVDPKQRPTIGEVTTQLRAITALTPDGAIPKLSPLWWAELEILSTEAP